MCVTCLTIIQCAYNVFKLSFKALFSKFLTLSRFYNMPFIFKVRLQISHHIFNLTIRHIWALALCKRRHYLIEILCLGHNGIASRINRVEICNRNCDNNLNPLNMQWYWNPKSESQWHLWDIFKFQCDHLIITESRLAIFLQF